MRAAALAAGVLSQNDERRLFFVRQGAQGAVERAYIK